MNQLQGREEEPGTDFSMGVVKYQPVPHNPRDSKQFFTLVDFNSETDIKLAMHLTGQRRNRWGVPRVMGMGREM